MATQTPADTQQTAPQADHTLECLLFLCRHHGKPASATSLTAGLPLQGGKLTSTLAVRAARRAGMEARLADRSAEDIRPELLPVIALLKNNYPVVITGITAAGEYNLFDPGHEKKRITISRGDFMQHYAGSIIMARPAADHELEREVATSGGNWFWGTLKQFRPLYTKVAIASFFINLFALAAPLFIMNVYDRVVPNAAAATLWVLAVGVVMAYVFDFILKMLRDYFVDVAGRGADLLLSAQLFQQVMNIRLGQRNTSSGALANQLRDFESLREFFTSATIVTLIDLPFTFLFIGFIALISGPLALIPLLMLPVLIVVGIVVQLPLKKMMMQVSRELDAKHGHLVEAVNGLETVKATNAQSHLQAKWEYLTGVAARLGLRTKFLASLGMNITGFLQQLATIILIIIGVYMIIAGDLSVGALVAATILTGRTLGPIGGMMGLFIRYQQAATSLANLNEIMQAEVERPHGKQFVSLENYQGGIEFKNVSFKYPEAPLPSLRDVTFKIKPGERVGVIGRTGAGKTSLAKLLMQLYLPTEGSVLLDGLEGRQLDPAELRRKIAYVPQQMTLFRGTLRENILLTRPDATDSQLIRAAEMAGVYDFAQRHPYGFEMPVGERGDTLSGGQRQAVTIARALVAEPKVLIMDEPTSEMDNRSEELLLQHLDDWLNDRTLILVTHRASALKLVDRLLVFDGANLLVDGPKDKVLELLKQGKIKSSV